MVTLSEAFLRGLEMNNKYGCQDKLQLYEINQMIAQNRLSNILTNEMGCVRFNEELLEKKIYCARLFGKTFGGKARAPRRKNPCLLKMTCDHPYIGSMSLSVAGLDKRYALQSTHLYLLGMRDCSC